MKLELPGLFWDIEPPKSKQPTTPPEPVWLNDDYLPGLDEARKFYLDHSNFMSYAEIEQARLNREPLLCDVEIYPNYFLAAFTSFETGKGFYFEMTNGTEHLFEVSRLAWVLQNFLIVTFNGINFDLPILALACAGKNIQELKHAANMLIVQNVKPWLMLKSFKIWPLKCDHVDVMEVCPQKGSLKIYGGRVHSPKMQDLPFHPETELSPDQITIIRHYCFNDLTNTAYLFANLETQITIRYELSAKYGVDLRSKSDAQIAEAVIKAELKRLNDFDAYRPEIPEGTVYMYHPPAYMTFETPELQSLLAEIRGARFLTNEKGSIIPPNEVVDPKFRHLIDVKKRKARKVQVSGKYYRVGIGGLHSCEENKSSKAKDGFKLVDRDVASYYPAIILNQRLHPVHLGGDFISVYRSIVDRRLLAKKAGNKAEAECLKIVVNGSYGKFGSKWSALYAPDLMIQVTLTGQLSLLMLIERLEKNGVEICSANTDGIVMRYPETMQSIVDGVVTEWERVTGFNTEETEYAALYCRDVNNYIAIKPDGTSKTKGAYFSPWGLKGYEIFRFAKNPTSSICIDAAIAFLVSKIPIHETIRGCFDITKFLTIRVVKGGACKDGIYLGKAVRWYYGTASGGEILSLGGSKVPLSDGAKPCMELPEIFPTDIDYARYESMTFEILKEIAAF